MAPIGTPSPSGLDLGESPFYRLPFSLPIGRRLRQGAGQRVWDPQLRQRQEIVEMVGDAPEEAPGLSRLNSIGFRSALRLHRAPDRM